MPYKFLPWCDTLIEFSLPGLALQDWFPSGLARTLNSELTLPIPFRALRRLDATPARHRIGLSKEHSKEEAFSVPDNVAGI